jgi:hypothetical protein
MKDQVTKRGLRCAIYTRVSTDQGLEQDFNSLDAQREASEAYIKSQAHEGWRLIRDHYDDGGFSGGSMVRPALQKLLIERALLIEAIRDAHCWLDELLSDPRLTLESLASREGRTVRSIRMILSLAFLAPEIVKAAVEGRLPRGFGLKRLVDPPMAWPDQWRTLGLQTPAQA